MNLKVHSIDGKGDLSKECVWFEVLEDIPALQYYMISDSTYTDASHVSNELRHVFWFPTMAVKKGDWIKLMTGTGTKSSSRNDRGTNTHVLYWKLGRTVWNKDGDCAILFKLADWKTHRA